jgi:hypothetical protein
MTMSEEIKPCNKIASEQMAWHEKIVADETTEQSVYSIQAYLPANVILQSQETQLSQKANTLAFLLTVIVHLHQQTNDFPV